MRKKIVAGNWKMNTLPAEGVELAKGVVAGRGEVCSCVNFIVCPPFTHLAMVAEKMAQAYANGLIPIYCVGENLDEREAGKHFDVVKAQIEEVVYNLTEEQYKNLVIAYEPVWAIGTGKTASAEQAQEIHAYIRTGDGDPLRRFVQALERRRNLRQGGRGRRPDRRRSPQGRGLPRHRQGVLEVIPRQRTITDRCPLQGHLSLYPTRISQP